jgi:hypothetical protein
MHYPEIIQDNALILLKKMVHPTGVEPVTSAFGEGFA